MAVVTIKVKADNIFIFMEEHMPTTEDKLKAICSELLSMDEDELLDFLPIYHRRLEFFTNIREWEEATMMFFLINGLRIKSIQMPEKKKQLDAQLRQAEEAKPVFRDNPYGEFKKPELHLVK
jgi:hypothetical protein